MWSKIYKPCQEVRALAYVAYIILTAYDVKWPNKFPIAPIDAGAHL